MPIPNNFNRNAVIPPVTVNQTRIIGDINMPSVTCPVRGTIKDYGFDASKGTHLYEIACQVTIEGTSYAWDTLVFVDHPSASQESKFRRISEDFLTTLGNSVGTLKGTKDLTFNQNTIGKGVVGKKVTGIWFAAEGCYGKFQPCTAEQFAKATAADPVIPRMLGKLKPLKSRDDAPAKRRASESAEENYEENYEEGYEEEQVGEEQEQEQEEVPPAPAPRRGNVAPRARNPNFGD